MAKPTLCPLLQKPCIEHRCAWFIQMRGTNRNTGREVDEFGCAIAWLPMLLVENANEQRQTGAAVESMRNESVKASDATRKVLMAGLLGEQMPLRLEDGSNGT